VHLDTFALVAPSHRHPQLRKKVAMFAQLGITVKQEQPLSSDARLALTSRILVNLVA